MKIAIVTKTSDLNYGNRLQNYALQSIVESMGILVETILNTYECAHIRMPLFKYWRGNFIKNILLYILNYKNYRVHLNLRHIKQPKFLSFNKKYIKFSDCQVFYDQVPQHLSDLYDYFIVGSDQVWNPLFTCTNYEFLTFAPKEKRIAYAASFGIKKLPEKFHDTFKKWLNGMNFISVREEAGADIIYDLIGQHTEVLVDPTLLLKKCEWIKIAKKPEWFSDEAYILTYFLGDMHPVVNDFIHEISRKYNVKIIKLLSVENLDWYRVGPDEFLYLIQHAKLVCTDSFHGTVFSILMNTPFVVCDRTDVTNMGSRIDTLLHMFHFENRRANFQDANIVDELWNLNFDNVEKILDQEREKSIAYLKRSLHLS